jgi:hypothetical protein
LNQTAAVSKPCCPDCWDIVDVLRAEEPGLSNPRAHHSTGYPVELPAWLPMAVCQVMMQRLQDYLCTQLEIMVKRHRLLKDPRPSLPNKHRHTSSMESDSGLSIASDASERSDFHAGNWHGKCLCPVSKRHLQGLGHGSRKLCGKSIWPNWVVELTFFLERGVVHQFTRGLSQAGGLAVRAIHLVATVVIPGLFPLRVHHRCIALQVDPSSDHSRFSQSIFCFEFH